MNPKPRSHKPKPWAWVSTAIGSISPTQWQMLFGALITAGLGGNQLRMAHKVEEVKDEAKAQADTVKIVKAESRVRVGRMRARMDALDSTLTVVIAENKALKRRVGKLEDGLQRPRTATLPVEYDDDDEYLGPEEPAAAAAPASEPSTAKKVWSWFKRKVTG